MQSPVSGSYQQPRLFVYGESDQNVDVSANVARLRSTGLFASPTVDVQILQGTGHAMMNEQTGWIDQQYLALLAEWILKQRMAPPESPTGAGTRSREASPPDEVSAAHY